ncbi:MAG: beta-N-acetylhexosaminidase [Bacteroidota bacterium]
MKKVGFLLIAFCIGLVSFSQNNKTANSIIPKPVSVVAKTGNYLLPKQVVIVAENNETVKKIADHLASIIETATSSSAIVLTTNSTRVNTIRLSIVKSKNIPAEGYRLNVSPSGILLQAATPAGLFYGTQTILQLLPPEINSKTKINTIKWNIPAVAITDSPRFGYRGLMLDVARHFFTKQQVKSFIDDMVQFKFNMLHLHLTDDEGWRVEIKSLPKLTTVGAWRAPRTGLWGKFTKPAPDEPKTYGGFYTQDDIKELVAYAKERFVNILPEVDMPAHSLAAVASYPELSCTPGNYQVSSGDPVMIWPEGGGHFYGLVDNTLCPANEKVYDFIDKVMTELSALFPYEYIHMGGDEAYHGFWEKSETCQQFMKNNGIKDVKGLQAYFVARVNKIINSKGKKMIGWDEILEGGEPSKNAAVMSWRGIAGGIAAAKLGHPVVMTPNDYVYVDLYQGDRVAEPPTYSKVLLNKAYKFDPLPKDVEPQYILGGQANLWSERLYNMRHTQYMLWPRALATAESVWSQPGSKNWNDFVQRVETQFERFDAAEINYSRSMYDPIFSPKKLTDSTISIGLETQLSDLTIHYTFDESFPDYFYESYKALLTVPAGASSLTVVTYRGKKQMGKIIKMPIAELKKRAGIKQ